LTDWRLYHINFVFPRYTGDSKNVYSLLLAPLIETFDMLEFFVTTEYFEAWGDSFHLKYHTFKDGDTGGRGSTWFVKPETFNLEIHQEYYQDFEGIDEIDADGMNRAQCAYYKATAIKPALLAWARGIMTCLKNCEILS
jgi:hypothetical protein